MIMMTFSLLCSRPFFYLERVQFFPSNCCALWITFAATLVWFKWWTMLTLWCMYVWLRCVYTAMTLHIWVKAAHHHKVYIFLYFVLYITYAVSCLPAQKSAWFAIVEKFWTGRASMRFCSNRLFSREILSVVGDDVIDSLQTVVFAHEEKTTH